MRFSALWLLGAIHTTCFLFSLQDYNPEIRHALREMFSCIHFATKSSLHNCILALLDSLKRYPQDRANVWR